MQPFSSSTWHLSKISQSYEYDTTYIILKKFKDQKYFELTINPYFYNYFENHFAETNSNSTYIPFKENNLIVTWWTNKE